MHHLKLKGEQSMKRLLMAVALACVLSGTALAGDIPGVDSKSRAPSSGAHPSVVVTVLLTIIRLAIK